MSLAQGFSITGIGHAEISGTSVGSVDLNKDGYDDVIIGAPGARRVYVVYGHAEAFQNIDLAELNASVGIVVRGPQLGSSVSGIRDINGDGYSDMILGSRNPDYGRAYVLFGAESGVATLSPTQRPTVSPTLKPSSSPTRDPTALPSAPHTLNPSVTASCSPTSSRPTFRPSDSSAPSVVNTFLSPTASPTASPSFTPSLHPSLLSTKTPVVSPTLFPSLSPASVSATLVPTQIAGGLTLLNINLPALSSQETNLLKGALQDSIADTANVDSDSVKGLTLSHSISSNSKSGSLKSLAITHMMLVSFTVIEDSAKFLNSFETSNSVCKAGSNNVIEEFQAILSCNGGQDFISHFRVSVAANVNDSGITSSSFQNLQDQVDSAGFQDLTVVDKSPTFQPTSDPGSTDKSHAFFYVVVIAVLAAVLGVVLSAVAVYCVTRSLKYSRRVHYENEHEIVFKAAKDIAVEAPSVDERPV
jgi:hypothetical protein